MKVTHQINIQRLILFKWLNLGLIVELCCHVYQQPIGIPMGTNCAPLVADVFLYSYEADFAQHLHKSRFKQQKQNPLISLFARKMMFYH